MDEQIVHSARDKDGREITFIEMDPLDLMKLFEAAGENSTNRGWMNFAMTIASIRAIDGVPVPISTTKAMLEATARKLGTAGLQAIYAAMNVAPADIAETAKN